MMLLDVGNTSVKWALEGGGGFLCRGYFVRGKRNFDALASAAWGHLPVPDGVALASVAGAALGREIDAWVADHWQLSPCHIRVQAEAAGVVNAYADPVGLGVDRWAALAAARHTTPGPVCIVDCGSAITIDVLDANGRHLGGLIAPGIEMMMQSLSQATAQIAPLPEAWAGEATLLAQGTAEAVHSGVSQMAAALIDRALAQIAARLGKQTETLITGGDASRLLPLLDAEPRHDPDLVLKGVAILAREQACAM